jgi:hypothetical protein
MDSVGAGSSGHLRIIIVMSKNRGVNARLDNEAAGMRNAETLDWDEA